MIYEFLADGFEIIEAMAPVDMLRRAKAEVKTVGISKKEITSSCGIKVISDISEEEIDINSVNAIILPGGLQGALNLDSSRTVDKCLEFCASNNRLICAICAAPLVLGRKGLLNGRNAVCFPGFEDELHGAALSEDFVVRDGNIITAKGAGVATEFGLKIVEALYGKEMAAKIAKTIQCRDN